MKKINNMLMYYGILLVNITPHTHTQMKLRTGIWSTTYKLGFLVQVPELAS